MTRMLQLVLSTLVIISLAGCNSGKDSATNGSDNRSADHPVSQAGPQAAQPPPVPSIKQAILLTPPAEFVSDQSFAPEQRLVWKHMAYKSWGLRAQIGRIPENVSSVEALVETWPGESGRERVSVQGNGVSYPGVLVWGADGTGGGQATFLWELVVAGKNSVITVSCSGAEQYDALEKLCPEFLRGVRVADMSAPLE